MYYHYQHGWIEVICGSMFAGKTEELIRRIRRLEYAKQNILVFKPAIDNRFSNNEIVSHNQTRNPSIPIKHSEEIYHHVKENTDAVIIDEVQFMDEGVVKVAETLANQGIRVVVAGLDKDFRGESFGVLPELLARAEFVTKLTAICVKCGSPATRTQRIVNGSPASYHDPIVVVGASEQYEPRCRHCHNVPDKE